MTPRERRTKRTVPDQDALYDEFIDTFFDPTNTVAIGLFEPDSERMTEQYTGKQLKDRDEWPVLMAKAYDVYITPCPQANQFNTELNPEGKMRRSDIAQWGRACWVDCDDGLTPELLALAKKWGCWIVESGSKTPDGRPRYHLWFPFAQREDPRILRYLNMHLRAKFDGDYKCDLAAFLRLPNTINHKKGQDTPVRIVHRTSTKHTADSLADLLKVRIPSDEELGQIRSASAVSRKELLEYLETYSEIDESETAKKYVTKFNRAVVDNGGFRHEAMLQTIPWVLKDAKSGEVNAQQALDLLKARFREALKKETGRYPEVEFDEMVAWSLAKNRLDEKEAEAKSIEAASIMSSRLLGLDELFGMPDPLYLIDGWLTRNTFVRIVGQPGSYKTFVAIHMAMCVAMGKPFFGGVDVEKGKVVYLIAEGAEGFKKRIQAWVKHYNFDMSEKSNLRFLPDPIQVNDEEWKQFIQVCVKEKPILIVLDTQARITLGIEESSNSEMGEVVQRIEDLRKATGATVLLVHHAGHGQERGRGASAMLAAVNTELLISKEDGKAKMVNQKEKDEADGSVLVMFPEIVPLGEDAKGKPITSVVLTSSAGKLDLHSNPPKTYTERIREHILSVIDANPGCGTGALEKGSGFKVGSVQAQRKAMVEEGIIENRGKGNAHEWHRVDEKGQLF